MKKGTAVVVTTEYRGVFFGLLTKSVKEIPKTLELKECRNCVYWSSDVKGFIGLSTTGPSVNCRVGPAAATMRLNAITSIAPCSKDAVAAWRAEPWK